MSRLDILATELHDVISILDKKLTPVLMMADVPSECEAKPQPILVELAQSLEEKCVRIESAIRRVQTITTLLEL